MSKSAARRISPSASSFLRQASTSSSSRCVDDASFADDFFKLQLNARTCKDAKADLPGWCERRRRRAARDLNWRIWCSFRHGAIAQR
jgi:hypothetical protein